MMFLRNAWRRVLLPVCTAIVLALPVRAFADHASDSPVNAPDDPTGRAVYEHVCRGCHMANARGARGAGAGFPALASNPHLEDPGYPISIIENGHADMPWFDGMLSDAQVAAVVNYIRTHFGNHFAGTVTPAEVAAAHGPPPKVDW